MQNNTEQKKERPNRHAKQALLIAGVDEAGRGPLAGPVIAAAVILNPKRSITGLADSKLLNPATRERLYEKITQHALAFAVGRADVAEIDSLNILHASMLAMQRAVAALNLLPEHVVIDGNRCPELTCSAEAIIKGDQKVAAISAASIIAKVIRDAEMHILDTQYPGYGFAQHKGYATKLHLKRLFQLGVTEIHRRSYAPVKAALAETEMNTL